MKYYISIILTMLFYCNANAAQDFIHFKENLTLQDVESYMPKIDNNKIKTQVKINFPDIQSHPSNFYIEKLEFTSAISKKTRPVLKFVFTTEDNWEREKEFTKFMAEQFKNQFPEEYLY